MWVTVFHFPNAHTFYLFKLRNPSCGGRSLKPLVCISFYIFSCFLSSCFISHFSVSCYSYNLSGLLFTFLGAATGKGLSLSPAIPPRSIRVWRVRFKDFTILLRCFFNSFQRFSMRFKVLLECFYNVF